MTNKLTREFMQNIISGHGFGVAPSAVKAMAEYIVAALDSEPVAEITEDLGRLFVKIHYPTTLRAGDKLYLHAQPAPEYPEVLPCSVLLEPGLRFGKGIKTSTMLAALARRAVHESDMSALSPEERAEFQARIEDFKALIAQPAPVVPDAYVRDEHGRMMLNGVCEPKIGFGTGWNACRAAMLQAERVTTASKLPGVIDDNLVEGLRLLQCMLDDYRERNYGHAQDWVRHIDQRFSEHSEAHGDDAYCILHRLLAGEGDSNSPVIPEGYVMVPMRLTAENGAKGVLSGEFSETKFVNCPECFGDDECETCDGSGRIEITVPVTWTTIKEIWAKGVEHFAAAPQEVK